MKFKIPHKIIILFDIKICQILKNIWLDIFYIQIFAKKFLPDFEFNISYNFNKKKSTNTLT